MGQQHILCYTIDMHALHDLLPEKHMHSSVHSHGVMQATRLMALSRVGLYVQKMVSMH